VIRLTIYTIILKITKHINTKESLKREQTKIKKYYIPELINNNSLDHYKCTQFE